MTNPKQADLPLVPLSFDGLVHGEPGLLIEIMTSPLLSAKDVCDVVGRICASKKYCNDPNIWRMVAKRLGIEDFKLQKETDMTDKQNVTKWCTFLNSTPPAAIFAYIQKVHDEQPDFIKDPNLWELLLEALGVKDFPIDKDENNTAQKQVYYWWSLTKDNDREQWLLALFRALGGRQTEGYKPNADAVKWIFNNADIHHPYSNDLRAFFTNAFESGDVGIVKLVAKKARAVIGNEGSFRAHVFNKVLYNAVSNLVKGKKGADEIWAYLKEHDPLNYTHALNLANYTTDVKTMKYLVEHILAWNDHDETIFVIECLRRYLNNRLSSTHWDSQSDKSHKFVAWMETTLKELEEEFLFVVHRKS